MQSFILINSENGQQTNTADNLNMYSHEYIQCAIEKQIARHTWNPDGVYKAIGSQGGNVLYKNRSVQCVT